MATPMRRRVSTPKVNSQALPTGLADVAQVPQDQGGSVAPASTAPAEIAQALDRANLELLQKLDVGGGDTGGYKLANAPAHHGWGGMQGPAQEWSRRLMGQFPGLRFSSGFRTPEENRRVNGAANSGHMRGWKADFSGPTELLYNAAAWARQHGARTLLHNAGSGFHLDVSWEGVPL